MVLTVLLAICLVLATASFHYSALRWLSNGMARSTTPSERRILLIVFAVLVAHVSEIILYAAAYAFSIRPLHLGAFRGAAVERPLDYLYFSIVTYTSLGLGDVFPSGHLRFLAGIEALNGLLLIAWSGSFIYLAMGRFWPWERMNDPTRRGQ